MRPGLCLLALTSLLLINGSFAQDTHEIHKVRQSDQPLIVSVQHATDSRGETVYTNRGKEDDIVPVVHGVYVQPVPVATPDVVFPKSMKKLFTSHKVRVIGVIAVNGDFIDPELSDDVKPDARQAVLEALSRYHFQPATLDGKPIAIRAAMEFHFILR